VLEPATHGQSLNVVREQSHAFSLAVASRHEDVERAEAPAVPPAPKPIEQVADRGARMRQAIGAAMSRSKRGSVALFQGDEGFHHLERHRIGLSDHSGFGHGLVLEQNAFHLEGTDQVAGGLDHVVGASDEPKVAVAILPCQVTGQIETPREAFCISLRLAPIAAEHRGPARPQGQLSLLSRLLNDFDSFPASANDCGFDSGQRAAHGAGPDVH